MYGDTIDAISKLQGAACSSTMHAELKAVAKLVRRLPYYFSIAASLFVPQKQMHMWTDSECLVKALKRGYLDNDKTHMRTDFSIVLRAIRHNQLRVHHITGTENPADIFTKPLPAMTHAKHTDFIFNDKTFPHAYK